MSPDLESSMNVFYHLTSVFDTSIYEALSKVIQKLIPEQGMLERLLDLLCQVRPSFPSQNFTDVCTKQQCSMDKAFLFDTSSKIYIATDSTPLDDQTYIICSDYIDLIDDFTLLYESVLLSLLPSLQLTPLADLRRPRTTLAPPLPALAQLASPHSRKSKTLLRLHLP